MGRGSVVLHPANLTGRPKPFEIDLPLPGGTPAGSYRLDFELADAAGTAVAHNHPALMFKLPIVAAVSLAPVTLPRAVDSAIGGQQPSSAEFDSLHLGGLGAASGAR